MSAVNGLIPVIDGSDATQLANLKTTVAGLTNYRVLYLDTHDGFVKTVDSVGTVLILKAGGTSVGPA